MRASIAKIPVVASIGEQIAILMDSNGCWPSYCCLISFNAGSLSLASSIFCRPILILLDNVKADCLYSIRGFSKRLNWSG